jgi:hypothetical protein
MDMLPDIYEQMPFLLRSVENLRRPRNIEQQVDHVCRYLDWYLAIGTGSSLRKAADRARSKAVAGMLLGILPACLVLVLGSAFANSFAILTLVLPVLAMLIFDRGSLSNREAGAVLDHQGIHAAEFYYYIKDALADPPEQGAEAEAAIDTERALDALVSRR